jgi:hypothetical protein
MITLMPEETLSQPLEPTVNPKGVFREERDLLVTINNPYWIADALVSQEFLPIEYLGVMI